MIPSTESSILYQTGCSSDGMPLIGGCWTLWHQDGFPLEMAHLTLRDKGQRVDWFEAMADASRTDNLPALMKAIGDFLPDEMLAAIKAGFVRAMKSGQTFDQILAAKRANGAALIAAATP